MLFCFGVVTLMDAGGTVNIHMFGAYFGLSVSYMIGKPPATEDSQGGHVADLFSLVGTIFLWIYWPSFNGGALTPDSEPQQRAIVNTIMALSACTITTFWISCILSANWKFRPVDIQNATLAGGVAIGAACHLTLGVEDCLLIGAGAGFISTLGFARIQEKVETYLHIHDTCGINNLHGLPSLLGGFASVILAAYKGGGDDKVKDYPEVMLHRDQWEGNLLAILLTLGTAISSGLATGYFMRFFSYETMFYSDEPYWEVMDDFGRTDKKTVNDADVNALRDLMSMFSGEFDDASSHSKD